MSAKGFKKLFLGENMPDKDNPQYKERYEKEVAAGRKFAKWSKLDKLAIRVQQFANANRNLFLTLVFGFVAVSFGYNIYRLTCVYKHRNAPSRSVIEVQDSILREKRHHRVQPINTNSYESNQRYQK